jgi:hypothetical protein
MAYNPLHDQLFLSASTDSILKLHSIVSISSAPHTSDSESPSSAEKLTDGVLQSYDQHEDSIYSISWNLTNPWIFASLSYDGRCVIHTVPTDYKYLIIL